MSEEKTPYKIVRTYSAGAFLAIVESRNGQEAVLRDARRLWYWDGAASLSQLAMEGTVAPENCKFPIAVDRVEVLQVIEIIDVTPKAKASIDGVKIWKKIGSGSGAGYGDSSGSGDGYAYGYGDGDGEGSGAGYGHGCGSGSGCGYSSGIGSGSGDGSGAGSGDGWE